MLGYCTHSYLGNGITTYSSSRSSNFFQHSKFVVKSWSFKKQLGQQSENRISCQMRASESSNGKAAHKNNRNVIKYGVQTEGTYLSSSVDEQAGDIDLSLDLDTAPGVGGKKQFPRDSEDEDIPKNFQKEGHMLNSTKQCYEDFPYLIRASCPLNVPQDNTAVGDTLGTCPDAGPGTGKRRFPYEFKLDKKTKSQQRSNHLNTMEDNLREVALRRSC